MEGDAMSVQRGDGDDYGADWRRCGAGGVFLLPIDRD
jgi:hypothetical protein